MSRDGKRRFLLKWVRSRCEKSSNWGRFKMKWKELNLAMTTHYPNDETRRWKAFAAATESFPETELAVGLASWNDRINNYKEQAHGDKLGFAAAKIVENLTNIDLLRATKEAEENSESIAREDREERRRQRELDVAERQAEARTKEAEAKIEIAKTKTERKTEMKEEKDQDVAIIPVTVSDDGRVNIVRDIAWVYNRLNELVVTSNLGLRVLNLAVVSQAPSNGAVTLASYALADVKGFFEKFVVKLLPRDVSESEELGGKKAMEESLDPSLNELTKFLEPKEVPNHDEGDEGDEDRAEDEGMHEMQKEEEEGGIL